MWRQQEMMRLTMEGAGSLTVAETFVRRNGLTCSTGLTVLALLYQAVLHGGRFSDWDWLLTGGWVLFAWLYPVSLGLPERVDATMRRLQGSVSTREAVAAPSMPTQPVDAEAMAADASGEAAGGAAVARSRLTHEILDLHAGARRCALVTGALAAAIMAVAWLIAKGADTPLYVFVIVPQLAGAFVVGMFAGRAVAYGRLGRFLSRRGLHLQSRPGHLDGAAGLRPVGELFILDASLLAVIAIYLGGWWIAFPYLDRYLDWRAPYTGLLVAVVAAEVFSFVLPLFWFHREMARHKASLRDSADGLAREVLQLQARLLTAEADRVALAERVDFLTARYQEIQQMPTWPIDVRVRRRFAVNNAFVFAPLLLEVLGVSDTWTKFWSALADAITGPV